MELVRDNIKNNTMYLVSKKDLDYISKTGIIKLSDNNENALDKVYMIKDKDCISKKSKIKVIVLKNTKTNKLSDAIEKINRVIENQDDNLEYKLGKMELDEYLGKKYNVFRKSEDIKKQIVDKVVEEICNFSSEKNNIDDFDERIKTIVDAEDNNETLIISEKDDRIYLPYTLDELEDYIRNYPIEYPSRKEVVKEQYMIPLSSFYKHPAQARFIETYNLMRKREKKIVFVAFLFAIKIFIRNDLNPAVIAACKSKAELVSFIQCLDNDRISDFKPFKIIYKSVNV